MGNVFGIGDAQTDERKNAQLGREMPLLRQRELLFGTQKGIEIRHKMREKREERLVEVVVELPQRAVDDLRGFDELKQVFGLVGERGPQKGLMVLRHCLDDMRTLTHIARHIGITNTIGVLELCIGKGQPLVDVLQLTIEQRKLSVRPTPTKEQHRQPYQYQTQHACRHAERNNQQLLPALLLVYHAAVGIENKGHIARHLDSAQARLAAGCILDTAIHILIRPLHIAPLKQDERHLTERCMLQHPVLHITDCRLGKIVQRRVLQCCVVGLAVEAQIARTKRIRQIADAIGRLGQLPIDGPQNSNRLSGRLLHTHERSLLRIKNRIGLGLQNTRTKRQNLPASRITLRLHGGELRLPNIGQAQHLVVEIRHIGQNTTLERLQLLERSTIIPRHSHTLRTADRRALNGCRIHIPPCQPQALLGIEERRIVVKPLVGGIKLLRKTILGFALRHLIEHGGGGNTLLTGSNILRPIDNGGIEPQQDREKEEHGMQ